MVLASIIDGQANNGTLEIAVELACRLVGSRRASLMLPTSDPDELRIAASSGVPMTVAAEARVRLGAPVSGLVAQTHQPMMVDGRGYSTIHRVDSYQTNSFISVPVLLEGTTYGVLNVADPVEGRVFQVDDLTILQVFSRYVAQQLAFVPLQQQVQQLQDTMRQFVWRMIQTQEDERRRVAREVHDEASHALTTAIFHLDLEAVRLSPDAVEARATLSRTHDSLVECAAALHRIAFALRPRVLDDLGLSRALQSLIRQEAEHDDVRIALAIDGQERPLGEETELAVFRAVQEALTNIRKHAKATRAWVTVAYHAAELVVTIEDNGVGLGRPAETAQRRPALGLVGLRERVSVFDGTLEIGQRAEGGTQLVVRLPLHPATLPSERRDHEQR